MTIVQTIIDKAIDYRGPCAVFARDGTVEMMPASGKRFESLQSRPERMALCVGVYDCNADPVAIAHDLAAAGVYA